MNFIRWFRDRHGDDFDSFRIWGIIALSAICLIFSFVGISTGVVWAALVFPALVALVVLVLCGLLIKKFYQYASSIVREYRVYRAEQNSRLMDTLRQHHE